MTQGRYCPVCGSRVTKESCCWYVADDDDDPRPCPLIPAKPWEAWTADQQFMIALLMERFGGAAAEWELLCRLPWAVRRFESCVCEPWGRWSVPIEEHPCIREKHGRGIRCYLTDLARDAYAARRQDGWNGGPEQLSLH